MANGLDALEDLLRSQAIGTVVLTAGHTGIGAVDPLLKPRRCADSMVFGFT